MSAILAPLPGGGAPTRPSRAEQRGARDLRWHLPRPCELQEASWRATRTPFSVRSSRPGTRSPRAWTRWVSGPARSAWSTRARTACTSSSRTRGSATASWPWGRCSPSRSSAASSAAPRALQGCAFGHLHAVTGDDPGRTEADHGHQPVAVEVAGNGAADGTSVEALAVQGHHAVGQLRAAEELDLETELVGPEVGHGRGRGSGAEDVAGHHRRLVGGARPVLVAVALAVHRVVPGGHVAHGPPGVQTVDPAGGTAGQSVAEVEPAAREPVQPGNAADADHRGVGRDARAVGQLDAHAGARGVTEPGDLHSGAQVDPALHEQAAGDRPDVGAERAGE